MRYVLGIDPGESGGIAVMDSSHRLLDVVPMPSTPMDILSYLRRWVGGGCVAYIEDVGRGMPGQSSSSTAKFARHNGHLEMALLALGIPTVKCTPQRWERLYQLGKSTGMPRAEWKRRLKAKAQELFPDLGARVTLKVCDALLIALYGVRMESGVV